MSSSAPTEAAALIKVAVIGAGPSRTVVGCARAKQSILLRQLARFPACVH